MEFSNTVSIVDFAKKNGGKASLFHRVNNAGKTVRYVEFGDVVASISTKVDSLSKDLLVSRFESEEDGKVNKGFMVHPVRQGELVEELEF